MARLTKKPIAIPSGVSVKETNGVAHITGPRGEERLPILPFVSLHITEGGVKIETQHRTKQARANEGTMFSLIRSTVQGVTEGFSKTLEIEGVGFRAVAEGNTLVLFLGYAHPVHFPIPKGVSFTVEKNVITLSGNNKWLVTQTAAKIRAFKKPEPYKGKGIRYRGEVIRRKVGKKAAAAKA